MYQVVVFLHVLSVMIFMFLHGVSAIALFVIARQENPEQVRTLLALRGMVSPSVAVFGLLILITGIIAASMGDWWRMGWPKVSVLLFIGIAVVMTAFGRRYFDRVARAFNPSAAQAAQLSSQLGNPPAVLLALVGIIGVGVILWLMLFKPF
jgi:hypothetical protein